MDKEFDMSQEMIEASDLFDMNLDDPQEATLEDQGWEYVASKDIYNEDGFRDIYYWYKKDGNNRFFFGSDVDYGDPDYFDWETEGDEAAQEWFDSYGEEDDGEFDDEFTYESFNPDLSKAERKYFILKLTDELQKEPYYYSKEEANDIAIKRADNLGPDWRVRWAGDLDAQIKQEVRSTATKAEWEDRKKESLTEGMMFKPMSLEDAKEFYDQIKNGFPKGNTLAKQSLADIYFFTNGFTTDYGDKPTQDSRKLGLAEIIEEFMFDNGEYLKDDRIPVWISSTRKETVSKIRDSINNDIESLKMYFEDKVQKGSKKEADGAEDILYRLTEFEDVKKEHISDNMSAEDTVKLKEGIGGKGGVLIGYYTDPKKEDYGDVEYSPYPNYDEKVTVIGGQRVPVVIYPHADGDPGYSAYFALKRTDGGYKHHMPYIYELKKFIDRGEIDLTDGWEWSDKYPHLVKGVKEVFNASAEVDNKEKLKVMISDIDWDLEIEDVKDFFDEDDFANPSDFIDACEKKIEEIEEELPTEISVEIDADALTENDVEDFRDRLLDAIYDKLENTEYGWALINGYNWHIIDESLKENKVVNVRNKKEIIKNAIRTALKDDYEQIVLFDKADKTYSFTRSSHGEPTTWLSPEEKIVGRVILTRDNGIKKASYKNDESLKESKSKKKLTLKEDAD